jgi:diguanylate cyclase (GGDEF)-like protein
MTRQRPEDADTNPFPAPNLEIKAMVGCADATTDADLPHRVPQPAREHAVLFAVTGPEQGSVFPLHSLSTRIGRDGDLDVNLSDDAVSRHHARLTLGRDGTHVEDLGSSNGSFVNEERIEGRCQLADGDHLRVGNTILKFSMLDELEQHALTTLFGLTLRDPLTGAYNRRYLATQLRSELAFAARRSAPLSLLLVDIDHFKLVNDTYGHQVGDVVLRLVATSIQRTLRPYDVLCRFGGEEFVVIARDTSERNAQILAERIRQRIEDLPLELGQKQASVTVSVGLICAHPEVPLSDGTALLLAVDAALYGAKAAGRNRVMCGPPEVSAHMQ